MQAHPLVVEDDPQVSRVVVAATVALLRGPADACESLTFESLNEASKVLQAVIAVLSQPLVRLDEPPESHLSTRIPVPQAVFVGGTCESLDDEATTFR